jgi:VanZ family protein
MRFLHWMPAFATAILIFVLSHQSRPLGGELAPDYFLHGLGYAGFALTLVWGATTGLTLPLNTARSLSCWLLAVGYGILDELHQSVIPLRTASAVDVAADAAGAGLAIFAAWLWLRPKRPGEKGGGA